MSKRALPLLFVNLGGEMIYILEQRLRAQNIGGDKARRVLSDIVGTMFNKRFLDELFKPQEVYSKKAMRTVFERLAHASIMRLNSASMDKLYDLMLMAVKYQLMLCPRPKDMLLITFNHLDVIRGFVTHSGQAQSVIDYVQTRFIETYADLDEGQFLLMREALMIFFQDMHVRVSIFLKESAQNTDGRFVLSREGPLPFGTPMPGEIRYCLGLRDGLWHRLCFTDVVCRCRIFDRGGGVLSSSEFSTGCEFFATEEGSYELRGDRVTPLGLNIYAASRSTDTLSAAGDCRREEFVSDLDSLTPNPAATAQLHLLSQLIGGSASSDRKSAAGFRLSLFSNDEEEVEAAKIGGSVRAALERGGTVVNIDARKKSKNAELNKIMGDLTVDDNSNERDEDLFDLIE